VDYSETLFGPALGVTIDIATTALPSARRSHHAGEERLDLRADLNTGLGPLGAQQLLPLLACDGDDGWDARRCERPRMAPQVSCLHGAPPLHIFVLQPITV
jgi:hypothetical protein